MDLFDTAEWCYCGPPPAAEHPDVAWWELVIPGPVDCYITGHHYDGTTITLERHCPPRR